MRAKFSVLKPYKMFRSLKIIFDTKRKQYENSVLLFTDSQERTIELLKSRLFEIQHIRSFYMDKFMDKPTFRRLVQTNRLDVYKEVKSNTDITLTPLNTGVLRLKNTFYPAWQELNYLFNIPGAKNKMAFIRNFGIVTDLLKKRGSSDIYKGKYAILDGRIFGKDFGDSEAQNIKGLCIGSLFYLRAKEAIIQKNPELWPLAGRDTILYDPSTLTAFPIPSDITTLSLAKFRWMLRIMHKLSTGKQLTQEDYDEENMVEGIQPTLPSSAKGYIISGLKESVLEKNHLAFTTIGDAFAAYCQANYPDASVVVNDKKIIMTMDEGTPALAKALYNGKLWVYRVEAPLQGDSFIKSGTAWKTTKKVTLASDFQIVVKKSGDKIGPYVLTMEIGTDHPLVEEAKVNALKKVEGLKSPIPVTAEQKELMFEIENRIEELSAGKDIEELKSLTELVDSDAEIRKLSNDLNASRLLSVQNRKAAEVRETLEEKQEAADLIVDGKSVKLSEKLKALESVALKPEEYNTTALNPEVNKSTSRALRDAYLQDLYEYDQYRIFTQFSDAKDIPIYVESIERKNTSTPNTYKDTLTIKFNIAGERPKSMTIDVPRIDQDGYLYIQGNRRQVTNQITLMPIVKIMQSGELVVQYNTSYNKIFLSRSTGNFNRKAASIVKAFEKLADEKKLSGHGYSIILGSSLAANTKIVTSLEFYELSKKIVRAKLGDLEIVFSSKMAESLQNTHDLDLSIYSETFPADKYHFIGVLGKTPLFEGMTHGIYTPGSTPDDDPIEIAADISSLLYAQGKNIPAVASVLETEVYGGKSFSYTKLEVSNAYIPLLVFLGFKEGLEPILDKYEVEYVFVPKEGGAKNYEVPPTHTEKVIFKDGTFYFNPSNVKKNLLVNGIFKLPTKDFAFHDFAADGEGYYQFFIDNVTPRYGKALQNFYTLFIDPITADVLKDNDIPNDLVGSFLYCNDLLEDAAYHPRYDASIYRIRNLETINALLYKLVARQIEKYRRGSRGDTAGTLAVRSDALFMEINESPNFEDSTLLNPIKDCTNMAKCVYRGPGAPGYGHAQGTEELRFFDNSQIGIYGIGSSFDGNSGMNRRLSMNTQITSKRGYVRPCENPENLDATNLYGIDELTASFTLRHADPPRAMMTIGQSGHQLPTEHMTTSLVSSGVFKTIPYFVSSEFAFKAPVDGVVEGQDPKDKNIINLRYSDGTRGVIDLATKYRRSPDGFFVNIDLEPCVKKRQKFKKGEILAYDKHFFTDEGEGIELMKGTLAKIAVIGRDMTLEDSSIINQGLADKLKSSMVMESTISLSPSTNLISLVKIGQEIKTSENLAVFEENLDSVDVSMAMDKMGESLAESLQSISRNTKTSKYNGTIVDIEVFYNRPLEEYSPSLQKFLKAYIAAVKAKEDRLKDVRGDQFLRKRDLEPQKNSKANGEPFDGVLIKVYTKVMEEMGVANKITYEVALKSVVGEVIPTELSPTSDYDDGKPIEACLSPFSVLNRKVPDFLYLMYTTKVLVDLKVELKKLAGL